MNHRPVCSTCETEMRASTNGVGVVDYSSFGPYKVWEADEYECPKCSIKVVVGFAEQPVYEHYEGEPFRNYIHLAEISGLMRRNYEYI